MAAAGKGLWLVVEVEFAGEVGSELVTVELEAVEVVAAVVVVLLVVVVR